MLPMISFIVLASSLPFALMVPPPPPVVITPSSSPPIASLLAWEPGEIRCGSTVVVPTRLEPPWLQRVYGDSARYASVTYSFDIDARGRATSIRKTGSGTQYGVTDDLAPALAVTRLSPGRPQTGCSVTFSPRLTAVDDAPLSDLIAYSANPVSGPLPPDAWKRIYAGGTCGNDRSAGLRSRAFPNFRAIPAEPGVRDWSLTGFDVDQSGLTMNVETIAGSGNVALDEASRAAVGETRYWSGGFVGCRFPYWRAPANLLAPPAPEEQQFRPANSTCPVRLDWATPPVLRFPEPYRRRAIEGWAVVTYDVAPWGQIDNIQVKASQPSEDFGTQAVAVLRSAKVKPGAGAVGCVERVRFVMSPDEADTAP